MASATTKSPNTMDPWTFPHYRESLRYCWSTCCEGLPPRHLFYDVKFYPYATSSSTSAPVFALVGNREIIMCRPAMAKGEGISCLNVFRDLEPAPEDWSSTSSPILNSCAWSFVEQSEPLLAVAGPGGLIKVLNAITGVVCMTLVGHGAEVNDLATHPLYPWILASASGDHSLRIWDLRQNSEGGRHACLMICGHGQGHKEPVLTCAWHSLGRYLISGGQDHMVCIWTVPDFAPRSSEDEAMLSGSRESEVAREPEVIHYPHFATSAIHSNYVDCVDFYGDLILSKAAAENRIVLWMAIGFNSKEPPPSSDSAPATDMSEDTRSGFLQETRQLQRTDKEDSSTTSPTPRIPLFNRLLEFRLTYAELFYMRFSLLLPSPRHPHLHPVLAMGNTKSKIFFWDLAALELGQDGSAVILNAENRPIRPAGLNSSRKSRPVHPNPSAMKPTTASSPSRPRLPPSEREALTTALSPKTSDIAVEELATLPRPDRYRVSDPFTSIAAHYSHTPTVNYHLLARQVGWSSCGRWCVIAGESGPKDAMAVVYDRWV